MNDTSISLCFSDQPVGQFIRNTDLVLIITSTGSSGSGNTNISTIGMSNVGSKFVICVYPYSNGRRTVSGINVNFNVYYI